MGNFDPIFGRSFNTNLTGDGPSWSEFYSYAYGPKEGIYYWTNLKMTQVEAGFTPEKHVTLVLGYAHMGSMEPYAVNPFHAVGSVDPAAPAAGLFGTGTTRGELFKAKAIYKFNPGVSGYISVEKFLPGDFYVPQDNGYWFRYEITYKFKGFLAFPKAII